MYLTKTYAPLRCLIRPFIGLILLISLSGGCEKSSTTSNQVKAPVAGQQDLSGSPKEISSSSTVPQGVTCNSGELEARAIMIYQNQNIGPQKGTMSNYINVEGYRYVTFDVSYEQNNPDEKPVTLGVLFAYDSQGKWGSRRFATLDENFLNPEDPQMMTFGEGSGNSAFGYNARSYKITLPVMGPFLRVAPFNRYDGQRRFSVAASLINDAKGLVPAKLEIATKGPLRPLKTETVKVIENGIIRARKGMSLGKYIGVDDFLYANVFVEFDQPTQGEEPVSLGIRFTNGTKEEPYYSGEAAFDADMYGDLYPRLKTFSGEKSWHGAQSKKSSYIVRIPVTGPFLQVFPVNRNGSDRKLSVFVYLMN